MHARLSLRPALRRLRHVLLSGGTVVLVVGGALAPLACSGSEPSQGQDREDGPSAPAPGVELDDAGCVVLDVPAESFVFSGAGSFWGDGVYATVQPVVASELEGWNGLTVKFGDAKPGSYDVSDDGRPRVVMLQDVHGDNPTAAWLAWSGTVVVEEVGPRDGEVMAQLRGVVLREGEQQGPFDYQGFVDDDLCIAIVDVTIDTRSRSGRSCTSAASCPHTPSQSCDPQSRTCVPQQCGDEGECLEGSVCRIQNPVYEVGGCYQSCTPEFGASKQSSCPSGQECVSTHALSDQGVCKPTKEEAPDAWQECEPDNLTTGCDSGNVCATHSVFWHYDYCYPTCDFFAVDPGCPGDSQCMILSQNQEELTTSWLCGRGDCYQGGVCRKRDFDLWWISEAALGEKCEDDRQGYTCDIREGATRNALCWTDGVCRSLCRVAGDDCAQGETCQQLEEDGAEASAAIEGVGVCVPQ